MDVFALTMRLKEEGAAQVKSAVDKMGRSLTDATGKSSLLDTAYGDLKSTMLGFASVAAVGAVLSKIVTETIDAEYATAQLNAVLISTKGAAGQSADALNAHAQALSYMTAYDDDAITGAQALLLTFTKIQGDTFPKATAAILDMAAAMNTDLKSATLQVGKALNDPILGVGALARAGVQFSEAQKEVIAKLTETGQVAEAQSIILAELKTQFEGSAAAAANTLGGALKKLSNELGNLLTLSSDNSNTTVTFINKITDALIGLNVAISNLVGLLPSLPKGLSTSSPGLYGTALAMLMKLGKEQQDTAKALAESQVNSGSAFKSVLADAFVGYQTRQVEIAQLIKLAEVKTLNKAQTKILRDEAARLTKEMNRENLSMESQYQIGLKLVEIQKAIKIEKNKPVKLAEVSDIGTAYMQKMALPPLRFDMSIAGAGGDPRTDPSKITDYRAVLAEKALELKKSLQQETLAIAQQARDGLSSVLGNALAEGIGKAFERGATFGDAMKAFGAALLSGLGGVMVSLGQRLIQLGVALKFAMSSFSTGNPGGMIAAGVAILAIGAALQGAAGRAMSQNGYGGVGGGTSFSTSSSAMTAPRLPTLTYGPTSAAGAAGLSPMGATNITIIGPNDPVAQRAMQELITKANRRGNV